MNIPGFNAEEALAAPSHTYTTRSRFADGKLTNIIIPSVPMPYCKYVCKWRVCGSPLPGYPAPMCYTCEQECWIHDSGSYSRSLSM